MPHRTRIKICGITSALDAGIAVAAGADAIGFICYPPSPRHVPPAGIAAIGATVGPFVTRVAVFVNPEPAYVRDVLATGGIDALQFHGDEPPGFCASFGRSWLKVARMKPGLDLIDYLAPYAGASGWLLDTFRDDRYGGIGAAFDWERIPAGLVRPLVLSGGLDCDNVGQAVRRVRPWAVDVSTGVELERDGRIHKGVKDAARIRRFVAEVRNAES